MLDSQRFVFFKMYFNFEGLKSSGELYFGFDEKLASYFGKSFSVRIKRAPKKANFEN